MNLLTLDGFRLPWTGKMMPHAVLDLLRGCNLSCAGCYNATANFTPKPVAQVREELRQLLKLRNLHTVSLSGGEPLLHPELDDIIREVTACGLRSVLMTNGVLFNETRAHQLKAAGLDMVLLHIQNRQNRPDSTLHNAAESLLKLRREKTRIAIDAGLDVGFSAIMYPDAASQAEISTLLKEITESESVHFAMICPQGDFAIYSNLDGAIATGYHQPRSGPGGLSSEASIAAQAHILYGILQNIGFGLFAWIGSPEARDPRWTTWNAGVLLSETGSRTIPLHPAWTDRLLLHLVRILSGRNQFHSRASIARFRFQLILSLLGIKWNRVAFALIAESFRPGKRLLRKHVVIELPPALREDGSVLICGECPDATMLNGRLVPPCLADRMQSHLR